jgi:hypothetical protein
MRDILEINEFFIEGRNQERSHVLLHITEPGTPQEEEKGYFFAVAEINNGNLEQIEHLQQMIDDLESGYYETDDEEDKDAFETSLEFINRRGHHILEHTDSLTNCLVGVLRNHEVSFAYHGNPSAILFYEDKNEELQQIDVLGNENTAPAHDQLFSSMMQGNVNEGDYFYVTTPHVIDYFPHDRIKKILVGKNTRQTSEHVSKVLKDLNNELSFGGIIFHFPNKSKIPKTGKQPRGVDRGSAQSLNKMIEQERSTDEIMSPPLMGNIKGTFKNFLTERKELKAQKKLESVQDKRKKTINVKKKGSIETNIRQPEEGESIVNTVLITIGRGLVNLVITIFNLLKVTIIFIGKSLLNLFILTTNRGGGRQIILDGYSQKMNEKKDSFINIPLSSKILLIATIILATIFIGSLTTFKLKENREASLQAYNNQIQTITDKKNAADASIIYNDNERAMTLLQEAKDNINMLPDSNKEEKEKIMELNEEVDVSLMKLRKLSVINPEIIADITQTNPEAQTKKLAMIDETLIAYGNDDVNLYKINYINKGVEQVIHNTIPHLLSADTPKENDKIIFITGKETLARYNKESSNLSKIDVTFPHNDTWITDLVIYNLRSYILDTNNNQIYRHNPTQTGYDKGTDWIKGTVDLNDAVSITIDGDIYILKQSGDIYKFEGGNKTDFNITGLDPKLENPIKIWTYNDVQNIYILEPTNQRVVVLNKEGKMLEQYTATEWQSPTGMIVNESNKEIFILDNNKVYKFNF